MPEHSAITDPNIHEPKDVSTATAGQVYKADGAGSGAWEDVLPDQTGNSGKFLTTNGTTASWGESSSAGGTILARGSVNVSGSSVSNSYNVASVSGSSTVTITFTNALASANYIAMATIDSTGSGTDKIVIIGSKTTTTVSFTFYKASTGASSTVSSFDFVIFG